MWHAGLKCELKVRRFLLKIVSVWTFFFMDGKKHWLLEKGPGVSGTMDDGYRLKTKCITLIVEQRAEKATAI